MADTYTIGLRTIDEAQFTIVATGLTALDYEFTGLKPSTIYVFEISVQNDAGETSDFAYGTFVTLPDTTTTPTPTPPGSPPPGSPPPGSPPPGPPSLSESPDGTYVITVGPIIVDSYLNAFAITGGRQIAINGSTDGTTSGVIELDYFSHTVYYQNDNDAWHMWVGGIWVLTDAPAAVASTVTILSATLVNNVLTVSWTAATGTAPINYNLYLATNDGSYNLLTSTSNTATSVIVPTTNVIPSYPSYVPFNLPKPAPLPKGYV